MKGKYIQFSTGDDGVPRRNGLESWDSNIW